MQTLEQFKLAVKIAEENLEWEWRQRLYKYKKPCLMDLIPSKKEVWSEWNKGRSNQIGVLAAMVGDRNMEIRIKEKEFPPLPSGYTWYNPFNLEPKDIPNSYRLLTKEEVEAGFKLYNVAKCKQPHEKCWTIVSDEAYKHDPKWRNTYIVPLAAPIKIQHNFV